MQDQHKASSLLCLGLPLDLTDALLLLQMDRHANLSLDMLLKLVAVFGPVIHSAISAPPAIGVNLQAEHRYQMLPLYMNILLFSVKDYHMVYFLILENYHRRECCNQCFIQLQKIQKNLPVIIR